MRILILDSDPSDMMILSQEMLERGFDVYNTNSAEDAVDIIRHGFDFDLLVMDANPYDKNGLSTVQSLRRHRFGRPIIVTDVNSTPERRNDMIYAGADIVMDWPIDFDAIAARARAYIRRYHGHDTCHIQTGNLCVDIEAKHVTVDGVPLDLTRQEYRMLEVMSLRKGHLISPDTFLDHMYFNGEEEPEQKTIDVYISKLRKKLREAGALDEQGKSLIKTMRGNGFILRDVATSGLQVAMQVAHDACPHSARLSALRDSRISFKSFEIDERTAAHVDCLNGVKLAAE